MSNDGLEAEVQRQATRGATVESTLAFLQALEVEIHHPGTRSSRTRLEQLLHPDFHEVGRSGRQYDRATVIRYLAEQQSPPPTESGEFSVSQLAPGVALLAYRSAQRQEDGTLANHTLRMSVWVHGSAGWQLRYHQGTPAAQGW
jgi:hypothetical protein